MPDRDNVIKRLEECLSASCRGFRTCPYSDNEWDAVETALTLLREQEPIEPTEKDGWHYCGACGRSIDSDFADEEVFMYCPNCGRKVKWDG